MDRRNFLRSALAVPAIPLVGSIPAEARPQASDWLRDYRSEFIRAFIDWVEWDHGDKRGVMGVVTHQDRSSDSWACYVPYGETHEETRANVETAKQMITQWMTEAGMI